MKNIFAKFQDYVKKPNRNTFDLSFYNNLTLKFGQLTPVFCKEVIPGDSFKIDTAFGLQLMPMKFPVQTPMKAYVHYFYVRNRTLWKDWMDFIGGTKEGLTPPYIQPTDKKEFYRVGGLADYFGIPNVVYSEESDSTQDVFSTVGVSQTVTVDDTSFSVKYYMQCYKYLTYEFLPYESISSVPNTDASLQAIVASLSNRVVGTNANSAFAQFNPNLLPNPWGATKTLNGDASTVQSVRCRPWMFMGSVNRHSSQINLEFSIVRSVSASHGASGFDTPFIFLTRDSNGIIKSCTGGLYHGEYQSHVAESDASYEAITLKYSFLNPVAWDNDVVSMDILCFPNSVCSASGNVITYRGPFGQNSNITLSTGAATEVGVASVIGDGALTSTPFDSDIHLSALPFRAYEAIYNAYYRNPQNNPFILNGVAEYNRYNTTYDGGSDSTAYDLFFRNWEYDFLTSAVQSPQQGTAPLVGISVTGEATFADEDGNTYYAQAILNDEGEITGWQSHSSNMPTGSLRLLMDMAGSGISINDLRNVNAFQRFLENNIRRGLKYRDQLMSHFGVKARYDELDMPEFIGGCSTSINVNKLSQTSESGDTPLGSFVGQASAFGQSKHSVTHYCDEHGFIIGIMSVVPVPVYSQLLPKYFVKSQQLDYYFPEFGHIGYQPIQQKEVSPLQTYYSGGDLNKVFGYNRAWYDYLASTDEVHGQFRTTMRDFLMNRTFEDEPELGANFLLVDPDQLNDVFLAGTDDDDLYAPESDKIIGSIYFSVSAKRPIPLFGIPKLTD